MKKAAAKTPARKRTPKAAKISTLPGVVHRPTELLPTVLSHPDPIDPTEAASMGLVVEKHPTHPTHIYHPPVLGDEVPERLLIDKPPAGFVEWVKNWFAGH